MKKCLFCAEEIQQAATKCRYCGQWQTPQPQEEVAKPKDRWDKWDIVGRILSLIMIPVAVAYIGNSVNQSLKKSDVNLRMVEVAVDVLKAEPTEKNQSLRDWAVKVIDSHADVKFSQAAREELQKEPLPQPSRAWKVMVRTVDNMRHEINGLVVRYVLAAFRDDPSRASSFPNISSPSMLLLPPGTYLFWCERDGVQGPVIEVQLSQDMTVEVQVPK